MLKPSRIELYFECSECLWEKEVEVDTLAYSDISIIQHLQSDYDWTYVNEKLLCDICSKGEGE